MLKIRCLGILLCFSIFLTACSTDTLPRGEEISYVYSSFRDIPGVTSQEIADIEELQKQEVVFKFGSILSTESFVDITGENGGFTAALCLWLTQLFGVEFEIGYYEWDELLAGLATGEIDFTGDMPATGEHTGAYLMTDTIAERNMVYIRLDGSRKLSSIAEDRRLRFAFLDSVTASGDVLFSLGDMFDSVFVNDYEQAYALLMRGEVDAFIDESTVEAAFGIYPNIHTEVLLPQIISPVSLATCNEQNAAIISVVQKALQNGGTHYLTKLYRAGSEEYASYKFFSRLTAKELEYIRSGVPLNIVAPSDSYPLSFYNEHDREFQGISWDILKEVTALTGVTFELVNDVNASRAEISNQLERYDAAMMVSYTHTEEFGGSFLWTEQTLMSDHHALLSSTELGAVGMNEVLRLRVGVVDGYSYTDVFRRWFPQHKEISTYVDYTQAFGALERGDIDLLMGSQSVLLMQSNYREIPGYKANIVFQQPFEYTFAFNKDAVMAYSIINKALQLIDTMSISNDWTGRTYDYMDDIVRVRTMGMAGAALLFLCILVILFIFYQKTSKTARQLQEFHKIIIEEAAELVEYRDGDTGGHIGRTSAYLKQLIKELTHNQKYKEEIEAWDVKRVLLSSQLHDVGKVAIGDAILCKPGRLTPEEYETMKLHTVVGGEIIDKLQSKTSGMDFLDDAKIFALYHHERWDGKGYPFGLSGEDIPLMARSMALIDVYDALVSERPYKKPYSHKEAIRIIEEGRGTQFDPELTDLFIRVVADKLNDKDVEEK